MPVDRIRPEFQPNARYVLDVRQRRSALAANETVYFHDSENLEDDCDIDLNDTANISHFSSTSWAASRGMLRCPYCFF